MARLGFFCTKTTTLDPPKRFHHNTTTTHHTQTLKINYFHALALNAQQALLAIQDEFLKLDARTAPHQHPPKKPATGGRVPLLKETWEDMKEADLYGYVFDSRKPPGFQDPHAQRLGRDNVGGRELRQRRGRDLISAPATEDEDGNSSGRGGRRKRRAVQKYDGTGVNTGTTTPRGNGWGGPRKRGASALAPPATETPEPDSRAKRAKTAAHALLPQRLQEVQGEVREVSAVPSSGDDVEDSKGDSSKRRGRPPGSKNLQKRSDAGIKKGPRKGANATATAQVPKPAPVTLESLSQGQNQFSIEPRLATVSQFHALTPSIAAPVATVFQAAPQPAVAPPHNPGPSSTLIQAPPEHFITTTPLSQYGAVPMDDSPSTGPNSGPKRKQRVKSEKRSQSMTQWWAERKARAEKERQMTNENTDEPNKTQMRALMGASPKLSPAPSSPASLGPSRATSRAPPSSLMPINNGLAALPSNPPINPAPRHAMPVLAPAPLPQQHHFTSPYPTPGPRSVIQRPKSNGPPPLAPAPHPGHRREGSGHISPYPPMGPAMGQHQHVLAPVPMGVPGQMQQYQSQRGGQGG